MNALEWLTASTVLTALLWVPYILERMASLGIMGAMQPVDPEDVEKQSLWAQRARRAHYNAVENLVVMGVLVLTAHAMGVSENGTVLLATQMYFWARLVHFPVAAGGIPFARTLAFLTGWAAQMMVALVIMGIL